MMHDLAWAAGLFEGEGSIRYQPENLSATRRTRAGRIELCIAQKDRWVLDRFAEAVGCGKVYGPYLMATSHGRKGALMFKYQLAQARLVGQVAVALRPWLSPRRQVQIDQAFAGFNARPVSGRWASSKIYQLEVSA